MYNLQSEIRISTVKFAVKNEQLTSIKLLTSFATKQSGIYIISTNYKVVSCRAFCHSAYSRCNPPYLCGLTSK